MNWILTEGLFTFTTHEYEKTTLYRSAFWS